MENTIPNELNESAVKPSRKKDRTPRDNAVLAGKIAGKTCFYLFLAALCVLFLFPVVWMIVNSMKTKEEIDSAMNTFWTFLPSAHPSHWFQAYGKMFTAYTYFGRSIFNSFLYCGITILAMLVLNSLAGYALTRIVSLKVHQKSPFFVVFHGKRVFFYAVFPYFRPLFHRFPAAKVSN